MFTSALLLMRPDSNKLSFGRSAQRVNHPYLYAFAYKPLPLVWSESGPVFDHPDGYELTGRKVPWSIKGPTPDMETGEGEAGVSR